jgi:hypothetical protein
MKKVLAGLLGLLAAAVLAFGVVGSGAWFTDQTVVPFNAASGKLDIRAEVGPPGGSQTLYDPSGVPIALTNLVPGVYNSANTRMISVQNKPAADSTLAAKYRYRSELVTDSTPAGLWAAIVVKAETGFCVSNNITSPTVVYEGPVSGLAFTNAAHAPSGGGNLPVNTTHCYRFSFKLDDSAGNSLQGKSATFNVIIDATQPENPGWSQ